MIYKLFKKINKYFKLNKYSFYLDIKNIKLKNKLYMIKNFLQIRNFIMSRDVSIKYDHQVYEKIKILQDQNDSLKHIQKRHISEIKKSNLYLEKLFEINRVLNEIKLEPKYNEIFEALKSSSNEVIEKQIKNSFIPMLLKVLFKEKEIISKDGMVEIYKNKNRTLSILHKFNGTPEIIHLPKEFEIYIPIEDRENE